MKFWLLVSFLLLSMQANAGLDITAYQGLEVVKSPSAKSDDEPKRASEVSFSPVDFPERFAGLQNGAVYKYNAIFEFEAGSYSGYGAWRNELAKLAGYGTTLHTFRGKTEARYDATVWKRKKGPFWELIAFSDADGVIGPETCKRVFADFVQFRGAAKQHPNEDFRSAYEDWFKAFSMCADHGAIVFH